MGRIIRASPGTENRTRRQRDHDAAFRESIAIVDEARRDAARIRDEARLLARQEVLAESLRERLLLHRLRAERAEAARNEIVASATALTRRIIGHLPAENLEAALASALSEPDVQRLLHAGTEADEVVIRVHPSQREEATTIVPEHVSVDCDDRIEPGGCLVLSRLDGFDCRIEARLDRLKALWLSALGVDAETITSASHPNPGDSTSGDASD